MDALRDDFTATEGTDQDDFHGVRPLPKGFVTEYARCEALFRGAKGGGKGGSSSAQSAPDTLFSSALISIVDLLCEGPILGFKGGVESAFLNDTPVYNPDSQTFNFKGLWIDTRYGEPDQSAMDGFPDVQTTVDVGIKVKQAVPLIQSVTTPDTDRVRVTIQVPALFISKNDGSTQGNSVSYRIEARAFGGGWVNVLGDQTISGKCSSPYYRSHEFALPKPANGSDGVPYQIRFTRLSPDTEDFNNSQSKFTVQSDTIFYSITSIIDTKFTYPYSAVVGLRADASLFGTSVPTRTYRVLGRIISVPSNYDVESRTYAGIWDGTFKESYCNNPAWVFYDLLADDRYGLGEFVDEAAIDKWALYEIAQYCDEMVDDLSGNDTKEPRYTFNGVIKDQHEAFDLLQLIAQVFKGMAYWSSGAITATQDRPADPVILATPANVINDEDNPGFSYSSSAKKARHTVAMVTWSDPTNNFKPTVEVVEDPDGIARYGYNPTTIDLLGCTSRGQAHRHGLWTLLTELYETQTVTYRAGLDHATVRPGDIVAVMDPQISNLDQGGRILAGGTRTQVTLDRPLTLKVGVPYFISVTMPDGTVAERGVKTAVSSAKTTVVTFDRQLSQVPDAAAVWQVVGDTVAQLFKVISAAEVEPHIFEIIGLQHEPTKFSAVDNGTKLIPLSISEFPKIVLKPTNLTVRENLYVDLGVPKQELILSWTPGQPFNSMAYYVTVIRPDGSPQVLPKTTLTSVEIKDTTPGLYKFVVQAEGLNGALSDAATTSYEVLGFAGQSAPSISGLSIKGGGLTFSGRDASLGWSVSWPDDATVYDLTYRVRIFDAAGTTLLHQEDVGNQAFTYTYGQNVNDGGPRRRLVVQVSILDLLGREVSTQRVTVQNPAPARYTPTVQTGAELIQIKSVTPADTDFAGMLFWISQNPNFDPRTTAPVYDGPGTTYQEKAINDETYYVVGSAYDAFGKDSLNYSDKIKIVVKSNLRINFDDLGELVRQRIEISPKMRDLSMLSQTILRQVIKTDGTAKANFEETLRLDANQTKAQAELRTLLETEISDSEGRSAARVEEVKQTVSDLDESFAGYRTTVAAEFKRTTDAIEKVDGKVGGAIIRITEAEAKVETLQTATAGNDEALAIFERNTGTKFTETVKQVNAYADAAAGGVRAALGEAVERITTAEANIKTNETAISKADEAAAGYQRDVTTKFEQVDKGIDGVVTRMTKAEGRIETSEAAWSKPDGALATATRELTAIFNQSLDGQADALSDEAGRLDKRIDGTNGDVKDVVSKVSRQETSISNAEEAIATLQDMVSATYGSIMAEGKLRIASVPASGDALVRAAIQVRAINYADPAAGWVESGTYWEIYQDPPNSGSLRARIANKADQFYIIDTSTGTTTTPMRVENGTVYVDKLKIGASNIAAGSVSSGIGQTIPGNDQTLSLDIRGGGVTLVTFSYENCESSLSARGQERFLRLFDVEENLVRKFTKIGFISTPSNTGSFNNVFLPTFTQLVIPTPVARRLTIRATLNEYSADAVPAALNGCSLTIVELAR